MLWKIIVVLSFIYSFNLVASNQASDRTKFVGLLTQLRSLASQITFINGPLIVIGQGPYAQVIIIIREINALLLKTITFAQEHPDASVSFTNPEDTFVTVYDFDKLYCDAMHTHNGSRSFQHSSGRWSADFRCIKGS